MDTKHIQISDYSYELPDSRIPRFPVTPRDHSKLLVYRQGEVSEDYFYNIANYLPEHSLMVYNNTKVIQARLHFRKSTGALIEVFLMEPAAPADYEQMFQTTGHCSWYCMVGNLKKWKEGPLVRTIDIKGQPVEFSATMRRDQPDGISGGTNYWIDFAWDNGVVSFAEILDAVGELPIPPYLNRETQDSDKTTYQTVYSKIKGSVAAPTAGLHFTDTVLADIDRHGICREELTLHVGAGTFKPVKSAEIEGHSMHTEYICVRRETLQALLSHGCHTIAVGTTSVRTLESLYWLGLRAMRGEEEMHVGQWEPYETELSTPLSPREGAGEGPLQALLSYMDAHELDTLHASTQIIIVPGYKYKIVERMITNFHQPQSTLLLLVSAFIGDDWHRVYDYALSHQFRFLSYGDSSILIPRS